jgi:sucrose-6-phosphate hydrolase SacC (GH32 family)
MTQSPDRSPTTLETPRRPASPPAEWPIFHLAHPGPGLAGPADPNCAVWWKGRYHLHYIYDRGAEDGVDMFARFQAGEGDFAFAHVSSADLVHWTWHPTTLAPARTGHGMFSGTAFLTKDGRPAIIYHGYGTDANHVAIAEDDDLERWSDPLRALVHVRPDQDGSRILHFDPDAWLEGDTYYAIFGGGLTEGTAATYFRSTDLENWDYLGVFLDPDLADAAEDLDVACPNFFPIGGKHMLLCISHHKGCRYYIGEWKNERFTPDVHGRMNWHAQDFFAPESLLTPDGRRVMWAWIAGKAPQTGIQSLPRELDLPDDGILRIRPLRELETLRANERREEGVVVDSGSHLIEGIAGDALELAATIRPSTARRFGIRVHGDSRGAGGVDITVDLDANTLSIGEVTAPFEVTGDEVRLRVFVDKFLIEAFVDDRQAVMLHHYADPAGDRVGVFAAGGAIDVDVAGWRMRSIYSSAEDPTLTRTRTDESVG